MTIKKIMFLMGIASLSTALCFATQKQMNDNDTAITAMSNAESQDIVIEETMETNDEIVFSEDDIKKISESFGHLIGRNLENPGFKFDLDSIIAGMRNAANGEEAPMSESEYEEMIVMIQEKAFQELSSNNLKEAEAFIAENATIADVKEIEAGKLQYTILEEGNGASVAERSSPLIHYTGKYINGMVFGSSVNSGSPISLSLDQTIPGFSKGLVGMKQGEKRRLFIHPDMGYGISGHLPPNSLLIFDVEIVEANSQLDDNTISDEAFSAELDGMSSESME